MSDRTRDAAAPAAWEAVTGEAPDGPWLVLVHGMSQDRRVFSAQVAAFRTRYRLLLVDLPGHGRSSDYPKPLGLVEHAAAVEAALAEAGVTRAHYWGTHTGAGVGLLLACVQPGRFASLVLEGPVVPGRLPPYVQRVTAEVVRIGREQGREAALRHWWEQTDFFAVNRARPAETRAAEHRAIVEAFSCRPWLDAGTPAAVPPLDEALAGLPMPVLIVNGEHDLSEFLDVAEELAGVLPDVRRAVIRGGGGFPAWECPEPVNAEVAAFLADVEGGPSR